MKGIKQQIEAHLPALRQYAAALTRNEHAADDLIQECLLHALIKENRYRPGTSLRAWLFTILHNLHVSDVRRNGEMATPSKLDPANGSFYAGAYQRSSTMRRAVNRAAIVQSDPLRLFSYYCDLADGSVRKGSRSNALPAETVNFPRVREPQGPGQSATAAGLSGIVARSI